MRKLIYIFLLAITSLQLSAADEVFNTAKKQLVTDEANIFSQNEVVALTQKLISFDKQTSTQIVVYIKNDLEGYDIADLAQRLGEKWKVGQEGFDNGIVILFKPKTTASKGQIHIATGYGIEGLIPDATANQIVENEMIPFFKQGRIYDGINAGVDVCISLTKEEFTAQAYAEQNQSSGGGFFFIIIAMVVFFSIFGKSRGSRNYDAGSRSSLPLMAALFMMGSGSSRGSGFGDFSSGSGSFGGGGSSFGGFGGGGFGGGGAGGSW